MRAKMVTRTIIMTYAKVMQINVMNAEVTIVEYSTPGKFSDDDLLEFLQSRYTTSVLKLVHIESQYTKSIKMGIPEEMFIRYAIALNED